MITFGGLALRASMKKSFGEAHGLALIESGDVVHAVLFHVDRALVDIAFAAREANLLVVIEHQQAIAHGLVGLDFEVGVGAFDGAQIAAVLLGHVLQVRPRRIVVGHADVLHVRQIEHANIEVVRVERRPLRRNIRRFPAGPPKTN